MPTVTCAEILFYLEEWRYRRLNLWPIGHKGYNACFKERDFIKLKLLVEGTWMFLAFPVVTKDRTSLCKKIGMCKLQESWRFLNWVIKDIMSTQENYSNNALVSKQNRPVKVFLSKAGVFDNDIYQDHELELILYPSFSVLHRLLYTSNQFLKALTDHTWWTHK